MNSDSDNTDIYNEKISKFISNIPNTGYLIEITKCCGYSQFIKVFKKKTLMDMYNDIFYEFDHLDIKSLYVYNKNNEKLIIPRNTTLLNNFILNNPDYFKPVYPIPLLVVYKIYFDDGCRCHLDK